MSSESTTFSITEWMDPEGLFSKQPFAYLKTDSTLPLITLL